MKNICWLCICFVLAAVSCTMAAGRTGLRPVGICTRDINNWGNASNCTCDKGSYDPRSGLCLDGNNAETLRVQGKVNAGMMAVGGETTGFVIATPQGDSYELILKIADRRKLTKLDGLWFEIAGELVVVQSPERGERTAIIVEDIVHLE